MGGCAGNEGGGGSEGGWCAEPWQRDVCLDGRGRCAGRYWPGVGVGGTWQVGWASGREGRVGGGRWWGGGFRGVGGGEFSGWEGGG